MWEAIQSNQRRSWVLVSLMGVILVVLGASIGLIFSREGALFGAAGAVALWFILWMLALSGGDAIMLAAAGAKKIEKQDAPQLYNVVEEMTIASGFGRMPDVYLINESSPNAFAIGRKPEKSAVAITSGLLRMLDRDELQGVMAHEIGHLKNRDTAFMVLAGVMLGAIVILADGLLRMFIYSGGGRRRSSSRDSGGGQAIFLVIALVLAILAPLLAQMLYFACSRRREYLADASSAQFTRYPDGLARALEKISGRLRGRRPRGRGDKANRVLAPMYIVNPMTALAAVGLFSTHPPTEKRVQILRSMGGAGLRDYEEAYHRATGDRKAVIGRRTLSSAQPVRKREASAPEAKKDAAAQSREVLQALGALEGLLLLACPCGMGIKFPAGLKRETIPCPRCGFLNPVPQPKPVEEKPDELRFERKNPGGWESIRCSCGKAIQLSPAFAASGVSCGACGRKIEVVS